MHHKNDTHERLHSMFIFIAATQKKNYCCIIHNMYNVYCIIVTSKLQKVAKMKEKMQSNVATMFLYLYIYYICMYMQP